MSVVGVDVIHHGLGVGEVRAHEFHSIPEIVVSPVLPVLDNAVERHTVFAVFMYDFSDFVLAFVSFTALPEPVSPEREHRHISSELTDLRNDTVGVSAVHKIIVHTLADFRFEEC